MLETASSLPKTVDVEIDRLAAFGAEGGEHFFLVTNTPYFDSIRLKESKKYKNAAVVICDPGESFVEKIIKQTPEGSCLMTIMPDCLVHSVPEDVLGKRKLLIMACRSGKTDLAGIQHFIDSQSNVDITAQERIAQAFFAKGEVSSCLDLVNGTHGTRCRFNHLDDQYEWHEQYGLVGWGEQQVFPSGEIACFLVPLYIEQLENEQRFELNGEIVVQGPVIVQSGPPSFLVEDQIRIHKALQTDLKTGVKLTIKDGDVVAHAAVNERGAEAAAMLEALFMTDSRFRRIYEVGFSINESVRPWPGNTAMNEVWGADGGRLHIGLGMLPHTQYHIDMFCADTRVESDKGEVIFGARTMRRKKTAMCPCIEI